MMGASPGAWLRDLRSEARSRFDAMEWPTAELEDWRRTRLGGIDLSSFVPEAPGDEEARCAGGGEPAASAGFIRFSEGRCAEVSIAARWAELGVCLSGLASVPAERRGAVESLLRAALAGSGDRVAVWHFAELFQGAFLFVPPGLRIEEPFYADFEEGGRFAASQVAVILGEGARATLISHRSGPGGKAILSDARSDFLLEAGSSLRLFELQSLEADSLGFHSVGARLGEGSSFDRLGVDLGGGVSRTRVECALAGRGSDARLDGVYYCGSGQSVDAGAALRHLAPGATSRATYKGAAAGGGNAVFQGLIEVAEGASGTDAFLSNRNLLLGPGARIDSLPTLKIGNDDVRCSHGSATGRLGEEELFYLRSRGFSAAEAKETLVLGFFEDILGRAPDAFREAALEGIRRRLAEAA